MILFLFLNPCCSHTQSYKLMMQSFPFHPSCDLRHIQTWTCEGESKLKRSSFFEILISFSCFWISSSFSKEVENIFIQPFEIYKDERTKKSTDKISGNAWW
jgi:hypothetical protein